MIWLLVVPPLIILVGALWTRRSTGRLTGADIEPEPFRAAEGTRAATAALSATLERFDRIAREEESQATDR